MSLVIALNRLQKARRFVKEGHQSVVRQRKIVATLERRGADLVHDALLLECLEEMQANSEKHRDQAELQVLGLADEPSSMDGRGNIRRTSARADEAIAKARALRSEREEILAASRPLRHQPR